MAPLDADRAIVAKVGPFPKDQGPFFVGIDVIGDKLTEINVTSPTGVQRSTPSRTKLEAVFMIGRGPRRGARAAGCGSGRSRLRANVAAWPGSKAHDRTQTRPGPTGS